MRFDLTKDGSTYTVSIDGQKILDAMHKDQKVLAAMILDWQRLAGQYTARTILASYETRLRQQSEKLNLLIQFGINSGLKEEEARIAAVKLLRSKGEYFEDAGSLDVTQALLERLSKEQDQVIEPIAAMEPESVADKKSKKK